MVDFTNLKFGESVRVVRDDGLEGVAIRRSRDKQEIRPIIVYFEDESTDFYNPQGKLPLYCGMKIRDIIPHAIDYEGKFTNIGGQMVGVFFGEFFSINSKGFTTYDAQPYYPSWLNGLVGSPYDQDSRCDFISNRYNIEKSNREKESKRQEAEKLFNWQDFSTKSTGLVVCRVNDSIYEIRGKALIKSYCNQKEICHNWRSCMDIEDHKHECVDHYIKGLS